jgi:hypothetical protein
MAEAAKVTSLDAIRDFKVALLAFQEDATIALSEATSDAQRGLWYITSECKAHWQRELKRRTDKLNQAKADLYRKQMETSDTRTSAVVERKNVAKWEAAVGQAEEKLRAIKRWAVELERQFMIFKAGVQGIGNIVAGDLPNAAARMERMILALEQYVHLQAPAGTSRTLPTDSSETQVVSEAAPAPAPARSDEPRQEEASNS